MLQESNILTAGIFITFAGNCREAFRFYRSCFGGVVHVEALETELPGYARRPVVRACLVSDRIVIHGSDLVHHEGRKIGNHVAVLLPCKDAAERAALIEKLGPGGLQGIGCEEYEQPLLEVTDAFCVTWVLAIGE